MARHRRRHRFMGLETVPGLSGLTDSIKGSVKGMDVLLGVGVFLGAHFAVKWALNKAVEKQIKIPDVVLRFSPIISGLLAGVALPIIGKKALKLNPAKVNGLVVGALGSGVAIVAVQEAKSAFPMLADYSDLRLSGMILNDPALAGLLLRDSNTAVPYGDFAGAPGYVQTDFAALAAAGADEESEYDF